jgi:NADH-quinone oxidoreductase subunit J
MIVTEFENTNFFTILWWLMSLGTLTCAILVVTLTDLIKAALALIGTFLGIAGFFILLNAEFLATVQTLIYVGAVSILIIFGVLMVQDVKRAN